MSRIQNPIGIFDSGIGGLTVANAILSIMPNESLIYFGDTAHLPYGDKSPEAIKLYSETITSFLIEQGVKAIIIACNSASSVAYQHVQDLASPHDIPVIDVVNPVVENIIQQAYHTVGVIGTRATVASDIFSQKIKAVASGIQVKTLATPLLAPMIEAGFVKGHISQAVIENYLQDKTLDNIEALVLACTHYPLIKKEIANFYLAQNKEVDILATNEIVAKYVQQVLKEKNILSPHKIRNHQFYVSDYTESFEETTKLFYQESVSLLQSNIFSTEID